MTEKLVEPPIEFAPTDAAERLGSYIERVLQAVGHPEAWVSDYSTVHDFMDVAGWPYRVRQGLDDEEGESFPADPEAVAANEALLKKMQEELRIPVAPEDTIVDLARRLRGLGTA